MLRQLDWNRIESGLVAPGKFGVLILFRRRKPGPLGLVRALRLCRESAVSGSGMMEYWNAGMLGLMDWDIFL